MFTLRISTVVLLTATLVAGLSSAHRIRSVSTVNAELIKLDSTDARGRVELLVERACLRAHKKPKRAMDDARMALSLADVSNDTLSRSRANYALGFCKASSGQYTSASNYFVQALSHALEAEAPREIGLASVGLAQCTLHSGDLTAAEQHLSLARENLAASGTDSDLARLHNSLAIYYQTQNQLKRALENYLIALDHAKHADDQILQARLHYNLGTIQAGVDDPEGAEGSMRLALDLGGTKCGPQFRGLLYSALGGLALAKGDREEAHKCFTNGAAIGKEAEIPGIEALNLRHLASMAADEKRFDEAMVGFERSLELSQGELNREATATSAANLALMQMSVGQFEEAKTKGEEALLIVSELDMPVVEMEITRIVSNVFAGIGDFERALELQRRHTDVVFAIEAERRSTETNRMRLQLERRESEEQARRGALIRNASLGGAAFLGIGLLWMFRSARIQARLNARLESQNLEIVKTNDQVTGLNAELNQALEEVRQLSGLLPICCHCKSIRNDSGNWSQIETYIMDHSDTSFSHGICPECMQSHYSTI